jgi:hypothetical protein
MSAKTRCAWKLGQVGRSAWPMEEFCGPLNHPYNIVIASAKDTNNKVVDE